MSPVEIGAQIRRLRKQQGRTLQEVADHCHCSKALLSKIETGKVVPALATLSKIANALGVKTSLLMEDDGAGKAAVTPNMSESEAFVTTTQGYALYGLAPHFLNKKMQPLLISSQMGQVAPHSVSHDGEEFIYVLEGKLQIHVGAAEYILNQGESIYFECIHHHGVLPLTENAMYLDIFVE